MSQTTSRFPPAAFIFDMDGVICDNMTIHTKAWVALFDDLGFTLDTNEFLEKTSGMPAADVLRYFLGKSLTATDILAYCEQKEFLYRALYRKKMKPLKGLKRFLSEAQRHSIPMGVATGGGPKNASYILNGLQLRHYFSSLMTAADVKKGKPDPEIYLRSAMNLGVEPKACLVFEDAMPGIAAAVGAGMSVVALTTSHESEEFTETRQIRRFIAHFSQLSVKEAVRLIHHA